MGNKLGQELREKYTRSDYQEVLSHTDFSLGKYRIIRFTPPQNTFCLTKTLDPCAYDQYASDVDELTRKLMKAHNNICEFLFVEPNQEDLRIYDLVFEFGDFVNTGFQNERVIWTFVGDIVAALHFLQSEGFHYPALRKKYTVYHSATSAFKLLNPNCFPGHVEDAIGLYLNPERAVSEKKTALHQHLNRNVKELGVMVLALITGKEETTYFKTPSSIRSAVSELRASGRYTARLFNFLAFTIENRAVLSFDEVREFLSADVGGPGEDRLQQVLASSPSSPTTPRTEPGTKPVVQQKGSLPARTASSCGIQPVTLPLVEASSFRSPRSPPAEPSKEQFAPATKKVRRIIARWCKEINGHREFVEYEDGSVEERPRATETTTAQAPAESSSWSIVLFSEETSEQGDVLWAVNVPNRFERFSSMQSLVDRSHPLRPALYHSS